MPNHVINEIIFRDVDFDARAAILAKVRGEETPIDFETLLPIPLNVWRYSVGEKHEKTFPDTALDWCRRNWSTKWNAYGINEMYQSVVEHPRNQTLTLTFQTAWGPPMGWILALFNSFKLPFEYRYLSEGGSTARRGTFQVPQRLLDDDWKEEDADEATARHLHKLLWGVEEFADEDDGA